MATWHQRRTGRRQPARRRPQEIATPSHQRLAAERTWRRQTRRPGFVNLRLHPPPCAPVPAILHAGIAYGDSSVAPPATMSNTSSANPTGPMHVGIAAAPWSATTARQPVAKGGVRRHQGILHQRRRNRWSARLGRYWRYLQALGTTLTEEAFPSRPGGLQYRANIFCPVGADLAPSSGRRWPPRHHHRIPALWLDRVRNSRSTR